MFYGYDEATAETEACSGKRMPKDPYRNHTGNYGVPLQWTALRQQHQRLGGKCKTGRTGQPRKSDSEIQRKAERRPYQQRGIFLPLRLSGPPDLGEESAGKGKDLYKRRKGKCRVLELEVNR